MHKIEFYEFFAIFSWFLRRFLFFVYFFVNQEGHSRSQTAGERINCCTLAQCPRQEKEPGPGQYSPKVFSVNVISENPSAPAFGTSGSRYRSEKVGNVIGAGRYNISNNSNQINNNNNNHDDKLLTWNFKSNAQRFEKQARQCYLKERIRAKDVSVIDRIQLTQ